MQPVYGACMHSYKVGTTLSVGSRVRPVAEVRRLWGRVLLAYTCVSTNRNAACTGSWSGMLVRLIVAQRAIHTRVWTWSQRHIYRACGRGTRHRHPFQTRSGEDDSGACGTGLLKSFNPGPKQSNSRAAFCASRLLARATYGPFMNSSARP